MSNNSVISAEPSSLTAVIDALRKTQLDDTAITLVDSVEELTSLIKAISGLPTSPPSLYVDLEGINLSRDGSISILQIYSLPGQHTYLVDVHRLGDTAFSTPGKDEETIKSILESKYIPKVFFDVRNDSDALYSHFGIHLQGIEDLQLMELATRPGRRRFVSGLAKCIEYDAPLTVQEKAAWLVSKRAGQQLFAPEKGGSYEVFNERPLAKEIVQYCANDVHILARLWKYYDGKMTGKWRAKMLVAAEARVALSHTPTFCGKGQHMAKAPSGW
ncbi:hypothetical protein NQ176_g4095 [Zarea fungicola]|uniref:Uncharacterized protein n=1 Tax=Zarea fungicola TaxID=93591 RepID=A0ACC1NHV1_9HYPO|nr:hypothetical protein NQ176_g4095 [Lecanicillium fungicola]